MVKVWGMSERRKGHIYEDGHIVAEPKIASYLSLPNRFDVNPGMKKRNHLLILRLDSMPREENSFFNCRQTRPVRKTKRLLSILSAIPFYK